jgi:uncharacterized protein (TIGR04255 family)
MAKKATRTDRLASAPLIEVVFELRWKLQGGDRIPPALRADPGTIPLLHSFETRAKELGFSNLETVTAPEQAGAYGVIRRYIRGQMPFPLLQVGVGIFAVNDGPAYEWSQYESLVLDGTRAMLEAYPRVPGLELVPVHLELKYINLFDQSLLNSENFFQFLARVTKMNMTPLPFLESEERFNGSLEGRISLQATTKGWKDSQFRIDIGSSTDVQTNHRQFRLESNVVTGSNGVPKLSNANLFLKDLRQWLKFARSLTSPFFKSVMTEEAMAKFRGG